MHFALASAMAALVASKRVGTAADDVVKSMPLIGDFPFQVYSGYLQVGDSTKYLHYIFAESQNDPTTDPLMAWYNGGPGCSSLLAFTQEHGPYVVEDGSDHFTKNSYSWNREANMLYIEAPAGVGYSYFTNPSDNNVNDTRTATDNLAALLSFFQKFPQFKGNDFYIAGESYGGIYIPTLTYQVYKHNQKSLANGNRDAYINLKGMLVGNGVTDYRFDTEDVLINHGQDAFGIAPLELVQQYRSKGCSLAAGSQNFNSECEKLLDEFYTLEGRLNIYDLFGKCWSDVNGTIKEGRSGVSMVGGMPRTYKVGFTADEYTPWRQERKARQAKKHNLQEIPPCVYGRALSNYLNREDVREALHVPNFVKNWQLCSDRLNYTKQPEGSIWTYPILRDNVRILIYSGDTDGAVPTIGTRLWIDNLNWKVTEEWRPYFVNKQVGGFVEEHDGLTFGTVHGAGHMAPQWKRAQTYHLIFNWIKQQKI